MLSKNIMKSNINGNISENFNYMSSAKQLTEITITAVPLRRPIHCCDHSNASQPDATRSIVMIVLCQNNLPDKTG